MDEKRNTTLQCRRYRILFLRSFNNVSESVMILRGISANSQIEYDQFPPIPADYRDRFVKSEDWDVLQQNALPDTQTLRETLAQGRYDMILLFDKRGAMFHAPRKTFANIVRQWKKRLVQGEARKYPPSYVFPLSLAELRQYAPIAAIDLRDPTYLEPGDIEILKQVNCYFKREIPYNRFLLSHSFRRKSAQTPETLALVNKVCGIPLGILDDKFEQLRRLRTQPQEIDIFFGSRISNTMRATALRLLQEHAEERGWKVSASTESRSFDEYCQLIAKSKLTISVEGDGWDCFRHYEAAALGSLPVINMPTTDAIWWHRMPAAIFFKNDFSDFLTQIDTLLTHPEIRAASLARVETAIENSMRWSKIIDFIVAKTLEGTQ